MDRLKLPGMDDWQKIDMMTDDSERREALRHDPDIMAFLAQNGIDLKDVTRLSLLEEYGQSVKLCEGCKGLEKCRQTVKGQKMVLTVIAGQLFDEVAFCKYHSLQKEKDRFLENIVYSDIPVKDKYLRLTDLQDLSKESGPFGSIVILLINAIKKGQKRGYYLYGDGGIGKTYVTGAFINEVAHRGHSAAFINANAFASDMRRLVVDDGHRYMEVLNEIKNVEYLAIDDLGAENITGFVRDDLLFNILDYRMGAELFTIFTSNLPLDGLEKTMAETSRDGSTIKAKRIRERIEALAQTAHLRGEDRRPKA